MAGSRRSIKLRVHDILNEIAHMRLATEDASYASFAENWILRRACERAVEIISEASRHIPAHLRNTEPDIPWAQIAGVGNVLRHGYESISDFVIWDIAKKQVGPLEAAANRILARIQDRDDWNDPP